MEKARCSTLIHSCPISAQMEAIQEAAMKLGVPLFGFLDAPLEVSMDTHMLAVEWAEDNIEAWICLDILDTKAIIEAIIIQENLNA